jgi:hypothetical protein
MKPIYSSHVSGAARWLVGATKALQASTRSLRGTVFPMDGNILADLCLYTLDQRNLMMLLQQVAKVQKCAQPTQSRLPGTEGTETTKDGG